MIQSLYKVVQPFFSQVLVQHFLNFHAVALPQISPTMFDKSLIKNVPFYIFPQCEKCFQCS